MTSRQERPDRTEPGETDFVGDEYGDLGLVEARPAEDFGGLLVSADLGNIGLGRVSELQYNVRRLILASAALQVVVEYNEMQNHFMREALSVNPERLLWSLPHGVAPMDFVERRVQVSSSVTVNPWMEVLAYMGTGGGIGAAVTKGLTHVPALLELGLRVSTLRAERRVRWKEFRNEEADLDEAFLRQVRNQRLPEAALVREALDELGPNAGMVNVVPISEAEVIRRRRAALRLTGRNLPDDPESAG